MTSGPLAGQSSALHPNILIPQLRLRRDKVPHHLHTLLTFHHFHLHPSRPKQFLFPHKRLILPHHHLRNAIQAKSPRCTCYTAKESYKGHFPDKPALTSGPPSPAHPFPHAKSRCHPELADYARAPGSSPHAPTRCQLVYRLHLALAAPPQLLPLKTDPYFQNYDTLSALPSTASAKSPKTFHL